MRTLTIVAVAVVAFAARPASAQYPYPYYQARASTAGESHARGMADVVRAAGDNNLRNSQAAINYEAARSAELDNRLKYTETHYEKKRMHDAYKASKRRPPLTTEEAHRLARIRAPKRPNGTQLDPITGDLSWSLLLQTSPFASHRKNLQKLFSARAASEGSIGVQQYSQIKRTTDAILEQLRRNIRRYPPQDYVEARRFVRGIAYEARFPTS